MGTEHFTTDHLEHVQRSLHYLIVRRRNRSIMQTSCLEPSYAVSIISFSRLEKRFACIIYGYIPLIK